MMLSPGTVKICSLREVAHAEYVVAAGTDLFGMIFAEARRKVDIRTAQGIVSEVRAQSNGLRAVGVFVDQPVDEVNRIADEVGLDFIQLHGSEPPDMIDLIQRPVIRAFRTRPGMTSREIEDYLTQTPADRLAAVLVDGFHAGQPGGSGAVADWSIATDAARRFPVILGGGLTPDSVGGAVASVRPLGVDVSSGVEVDGQKSRERMISFVREARSAFAALEAQSSMSI
jgi:phosphoribosylanthranilate isomerase